MASADELYWTIKGKASHAAQPHLSNDPILAASNLINYYQSLMVKARNPLDPGVLSVTSIHGGTATNIFPEEVKLMGTLRAYNNEWREQMHELIVNAANSISAMYGCTAEVEILKGYPPLVNHTSLTNFAKEVSTKLVGMENTLHFEPKMWAEDFAFYAQKIPAVFWFLGVKSPEAETMPPLHNPKIAPIEDAMINGITMLVATAVEYLRNHS